MDALYERVDEWWWGGNTGFDMRDDHLTGAGNTLGGVMVDMGRGGRLGLSRTDPM